MVLWIAKFVGCILIIRAAMQRTADSYDGVERRHTRRLGIFAALFSALIYSAASLADILYINPGEIDEAFDMIMGEYSKFLDSNSLTMIYCFLYGTIVASILSRYIPDVDPFAGFHDSGTDVEEQ